MRKAAIPLTLALALGAAVLPRLLGTVAPSAEAQAPPASAPPSAPGVPVTADTVATADVPVFLQAIGTAQAYNMVTIKSRVDGQIVKIAFAEGQDAKAGDPLIQIDPRPFQAVLDQAMATKQKDEAQLASAQADLVRWAELVPQGVKSRQTYDQQKALVQQLQAALKADEAQIEAARLNLGYADIRAPISGRLGIRMVDIGNMVRATDAAGLVTISQLKPMFVSFTVPQENLHKIHQKKGETGELAVIALGADNKTELARGKLSVIDNAIDQPTGTIRIKATFANDDERLWPGEFVNVRLILSVRTDRAGRPDRLLRVCHQGRQHRRAAGRRSRSGSGWSGDYRQGSIARRTDCCRWSIPADERRAGQGGAESTRSRRMSGEKYRTRQTGLRGNRR